MSHDLLQDTRLTALLNHIDHDLAAAVRRQGCSCGSALHQANYPRKPRGPQWVDADESWTTRLSFCCGREGCRRRSTPPSVRFLGRKVYVAVVVTLGCVTRGRRLSAHVRVLEETLRVSPATVRRWLAWWRQAFATTDLWVGLRGMFMPPPDEAKLPATLLAKFNGVAHEALISFLKFISPVTTRTVHAM